MTEPSRPLISRIRAFAAAVARRGAPLQLPQTAASLAFLSLLALVPVFTIAISLLGALPMLAELRVAVLSFVASNLFLPSFSDTLVHYLNQFSEKAGELSALGALVFFASAFSALLTIDGALNRIWDTRQRRPLARRLTIYWTFLTLGPLLVAASVAVNGMIVSEVLGGVSVPALQRVWVAALPWLSSIIGLTLLYRIVPNAPVRWRDALLAALLAAVVLELLKRGMGLQAARLPTYTVVYGAFALLPILLIWLFLLWLTVLGGAVVAACAPAWGAGSSIAARPTPASRFAMAAAVLGRLVAASRQGRATYAASAARDVFSGDPERATDIVGLLHSLGYVDRLWRLPAADPREGDSLVWDEQWALAPGALKRSLRPLFECLWRAQAPSATAPAENFDAGAIDLALEFQPAEAPTAAP